MKIFTMLLFLALSVPAAAQNVTEIRYQLRFDSTTAKQRMLEVTTTFRSASATPVLLSLPEDLLDETVPGETRGLRGTAGPRSGC
jgi:thiamine pyrophosphate-dependent acetolactate synthase large subunit-like protein